MSPTAVVTDPAQVARDQERRELRRRLYALAAEELTEQDEDECAELGRPVLTLISDTTLSTEDAE